MIMAGAFRVPAAMIKSLETGPSKRRGLWRELGGLYHLRSRAIHGDVADMDEIDQGATSATQVALAALRELYRRGTSGVSMKTRRSLPPNSGSDSQPPKSSPRNAPPVPAPIAARGAHRMRRSKQTFVWERTKAIIPHPHSGCLEGPIWKARS
jgi:hypothetical protein